MCRGDESDVPHGSQLQTNESVSEPNRDYAERSELRLAIRRFLRYKPGVVGLLFILLLSIIAVFPGVFAPYSPAEQQLSMRGAPPSREHLLGMDHIGRDILSRLVHGTRIALVVGISVISICVPVGVGIGAIGGYLGGIADTLLSRVTDTLMAFPLLALLVALSAVLGPSLWTVIVVLGLTIWTPYARVTRADVLSLREQEFVLSAQAAGARTPRIIIRHLLPNIMGPIIVMATLGIGWIIIIESVLSFFGLGVQPPIPSWGNMLADSRPYLRHYPHMAVSPGVMITLTVIAFNLVGDGLRDALDPRTRKDL